VAEFHYILMTADRHTVCWKWEESQNKLFFQKHILKQLQTLSGPLDVTLTHLNSELFALWYLSQTNVFRKYHVFPSRITLKKNISVYQWPHKGTIFRSAISVPNLNVLYVCPVFSGDLVLFVSHSDDTALFLFLLFSFLFSFSFC